MKEFDLIVIGAGPAGYTAALKGAGAGLKTALIDKNLANTGGTCLNEGCIPLKGYLYHAHSTKDYNSIKTTVAAKVKILRDGLTARLKAAGIELIEAAACLEGAGTVIAGTEKLKAKNIIIACGSKPRKLFQGALPSEKIFSLDKAPGTALIIGGGVIGCEYASFLNSIGVNVEIAEITPFLLPGPDSDEEAVRTLAREFKKKGIKVHAPAKVVKAEKGKAVLEVNGKSEERQYDIILEATGRVPAFDGLGLDTAGIELTEKGFIKTGNGMATSAFGVFAAGDCIETPMLAYAAYAEAEAAVAAIAGGETHAIDYKAMPKLTFSSPQVGSAGVLAGAKVYKYFFKAIGKAVVEGKDTGFVKIFENESGEICGASCVGDEIADIMNELAVIIKNKLTPSQVMSAVHIHPSYSEIITEALIYGLQK